MYAYAYALRALLVHGVDQHLAQLLLLRSSWMLPQDDHVAVLGLAMLERQTHATSVHVLPQTACPASHVQLAAGHRRDVPFLGYENLIPHA